ncbi:unnamed protein product [Lactuca virosa]|uniref:Protein kinase domain-containing protein n=1 Tax=Lactuca virosa TaxID=75947 RepID=A0AAU9NXS8_9ASTR|nr:unnamed protein product [Lactuca virosa]
MISHWNWMRWLGMRVIHIKAKPSMNDITGELDEMARNEGRSHQWANPSMNDITLELDEMARNEGYSHQLAKPSMNDITGELDETARNEGHSHQLANPSMNDITGELDASFEHERHPPRSFQDTRQETADNFFQPMSIGGILDMRHSHGISYNYRPPSFGAMEQLTILYNSTPPSLGEVGHMRYPISPESYGQPPSVRDRPRLDKEFLAPLAIFHYDEGTLEDIIDPDLWKQIDKDSFKIFSETAYNCLKEERGERPHIDQIIIRLDKALDLQRKHENNLKLKEKPEVASEVEGTSTNHVKWKGMEHLMIRYNDIEMATSKFTQNRIGYGGFGDVYKAELEHFDIEKSSAGEKNLNDLPKICSSVAVKRLFKRSGTEADTSYTKENPKGIAHFARQHFNKGTLTSMLDPILKEEIDENNFTLSKGPNTGSLKTFLNIAHKCLAETQADRPKIGYVISKIKDAMNLQENHRDNLKISLEDIKLATNNFKKRPTTHEVLLQLKKALEFQEDYVIWKPKLPNDYEEIFKMSNSCDVYSTEKKKELYNMLRKGILLQHDKVLFSLGDNGERNEMISARKFSYKHCLSHKWQSIPESRFPKVAKMSDLSNLKIRLKIRPQLLARGVNYSVHLFFKFCGPRKSLAKGMYVNLKYKLGIETLHAYFATWREDGWMMIELCRFSNDKEDIDFEFLLESFSQCYCGSRAIYVEGIQFLAIDNVKDVEIDELKNVPKVLKSDLNMDQLQKLPTNCEEIFNDGEKILLLVNGKKHLMLSAKAALLEYPNAMPFQMKPSTQSRFGEEIELLPQQVLRINCRIKSEWLSRDTEYVCYLVFKISEKCIGLHCPVKVHNLLHGNNKKPEILYFRCPWPWNLHDTNQAPKQRADGWMEVRVWKLNSKHRLENDHFHVKLKLIIYEGTMSGLILCGLEFRAM